VVWALASLTVLATGCASVSPANAPAAARNTPSDKLCTITRNSLERLLVAGHVLSAAEAELSRRGETCAAWYAKSQRDAAALGAAAAVFNRSAMPSPATANRSTGFFKRDYTSGFNRICIYDSLGSEVAITIRSVDICPLTN